MCGRGMKKTDRKGKVVSFVHICPKGIVTKCPTCPGFRLQYIRMGFLLWLSFSKSHFLLRRVVVLKCIHKNTWGKVQALKQNCSAWIVKVHVKYHPVKHAGVVLAFPVPRTAL